MQKKKTLDRNISFKRKLVVEIDLQALLILGLIVLALALFLGLVMWLSPTSVDVFNGGF